jgi:hypothetical protein
MVHGMVHAEVVSDNFFCGPLSYWGVARRISGMTTGFYSRGAV